MRSNRRQNQPASFNPTKLTFAVMAALAVLSSAHAGGTGANNQKNADNTALETEKCDATGCARASVVLSMVSLRVKDIPVGYQPPVGPEVKFRVAYNEFDASLAATPNHYNLGAHWSTDWLAFVQDNPNSAGSGVSLVEGGGGSVSYNSFSGSAAGGTFRQEERTGAVLKLVSFAPVKYERNFPDGSKEVYAQADAAATAPRRVFLTQKIDAHGNALTFAYDSSMRLTSITDAVGQVTTLQYTNANNPLLLTGVTDPFGRTATLGYDASGQLNSLTDAVGMTSTFTYGTATGVSGNVMTSMTTPYGTSSFVTYQDPYNPVHRWITTTDPLNHTSKVEIMHTAPGVPFSDSLQPSGMVLFNAYLNYRNTYHWDPVAYANAGNDYNKATIYHWVHDSQTGETAGTLESLKLPLENRIWYNYPGQTWGSGTGSLNQPNRIARVLPNGVTQLTQYNFNGQANPTSYIDPAGRTTTYTYAANGIDLTKAEQTNGAAKDTLASLSYDAQHQPLTRTDAAGQTTTLSYNSAGQPLTVQDALGQVHTLNYDSQGYLTQIVAPNGSLLETRTYDSVGRMATRTDSEGYTVGYQYDNLDRLTQETYPDGTSRSYSWNKLDLGTVTDRQGRTTSYTYDAARNLVSETDPLGRTTHYGYDAANRLVSLTDPASNITTWGRDIQGRVISKTYPDGKQDTYAYDTAGRLTDTTDARGQTVRRSYTVDNRVAGVQYLNASNPTPNVSFTQDSAYPRVKSMSDGLGNTQYSYVPAGSLGAGQLANIDGPYANDAIAQGYDALGRLNSRSVGGDNETFGYDALGRVTSHTNALGQFSFSHLGQTQQTTLQQLLGGFGISSLYASNSLDRQLSAIVPGATGSTAPAALQLYKARPENQLAKHAEFPGWSENYSYDSANRLTQASRPGTESDYWLQQGYPADVQARIQQYANSGTTSGSKRATPAVPATPNGPGVPATPATPAIPAHKAQQVTLPGDYAYSFDAASNLTQVSTPDGSWSAVANANNQYSSAQGSPWVYDEAGNLLDDGKRSYRWDAQSRLVGTTDKASGQVNELAYDGLSRLTVVKTTPAGGATSETRYTWCGETICQKRNDSDTVQARYLEEGEVNAGQALYYVKDRLGSVTDVVDAQGNPQGQLDYGPYGEEQQTSGTVSDKRYAGMQYLPQAGLYATHYRFYDANSARWLNRDPIAENGGVNLYGYVDGNPVMYFDPDGLVRYNAPAPRTVPVSGPTGDALQCVESCLQKETNNQSLDLLITGGAEKAGHSKSSHHYKGEACDIANSNFNPGLTNKNVATCAVACGFGAGQFEAFSGNPGRDHWHLQLEPGNGVKQLEPGASLPVKVKP